MSFSCTPNVVTPSGTTLIPYADRLDVSRGLSETTDWSLSVRDDFRELNPDNPSGPWAGVLDERAYDADGITYAKTLQITVNDGADHVLPHGVPDSYGYEITGDNLHEAFTWKGKGPASKLFRPHLSLLCINSTKTAATSAAAWNSGTEYANGDFVTYGGHAYESLQAANVGNAPDTSPIFWVEADTGHLYYAQDLLEMICGAYGMTCDASAVSPNYLVARMTMADGSPIEWIRQLLDVTQAEWYEDGAGLVFFQPDWEGTTWDRSYTTGDRLRRFSTSSSAVVDFANYLICRRADDVGGRLARSDKKDTPFGRQGYVSFSQPVPVSSVSWATKLEHLGKLSDFYFYGPAGPPARPIDARALSSTPPLLQSGTMAHGVEFTLGAAPPPWTPLGTTMGSYAVEFRADTSNGVYADTTTAIVVQNTESIAGRRGRIQGMLGPNPLIADLATLQTWGERTLYKRSRRAVECQGTLYPGDYDLRPGHRVRVTDSQFGTSRIFTVKKVNHPLFASRPTDFVTQFTGVQYV